ncbi:hypothetical protein U1Q18_014617 [Sarracenia purpurea var. burkii]
MQTVGATGELLQQVELAMTVPELGGEGAQRWLGRITVVSGGGQRVVASHSDRGQRRLTAHGGGERSGGVAQWRHIVDSACGVALHGTSVARGNAHGRRNDDSRNDEFRWCCSGGKTNGKVAGAGTGCFVETQANLCF